uniref:Uncharacterized protein n=1 Tax=Acrobeloides nanus TaxID=290746 RepID=A0A914DZ58_9BILA
MLSLMSDGICKPIHYEHEIEEEEDTTDANKSFEYKHSELEREFWGKILDFEKGPDENKTIQAEKQESFLLDVIAVFAIASLCLITLWVVVLYAYGYQSSSLVAL